MKIIKEIAMVALGSIILAFAVAVFLIPHNILSGGVSGIAVALYPIFHIEPTIMVNILIAGLFIIGSLFLGKKFAISTALSSIIYPVALHVITAFGPIVQLDAILASVYGGILGGIGIGIVFRAGASTGGMDVPPLIIHKLTGWPVHNLVLAVDTLTILLGVFTMGLEAVLIGFISVYTCSMAINKVLIYGGESAKSILIISNKQVEISNHIHEVLSRGTTILKAYGGYTKESRDVLLVVITMNQYPQLSKIVSELDPNAFMIVQDATEVKGEGFTLEYRV